MSSRRCLLFLLVLLTLSESQARQIIWRIPSNKNNVTSDGQALTAGMLFELGCFTAGFVPTRTNTDEWAEHWHLLDRSSYRAEDSTFSDAVTVSSNAAPFAPGVPVYIWGYRARAGSNEWILAGSPSWLMPSPATIDFALSWVLTDSANLIVGSVQATSAPIFLQTEAVTGALPVLLPEAWRSESFTLAQLADPAVSGWLADPDEDGLTNMQEYALDTEPGYADAIANLAVEVIEEKVTATLQRPSNRLVKTSIQVSPDPPLWQFPNMNMVLEVRTTVSTESVTMGSHRPRLFFRCFTEWLPGLAPDP